jgi:AcrR family transcriptional regulator
VAKRVDRRVERTRHLLREALLSLVREKRFESVTVQEVIERANVGRATFYAHFDNMEDLLLSGLDGLRASLKEVQREALAQAGSPGEPAFAFSRPLFEHAHAHRELFRAMAREPSAGLVRQALHKIVVDLVREDVAAVVPRDEGSSIADAATQFVAGGLFGLLIWWLEAGARPGPDEADEVFRRLALPALEAAAR